MGAGGSELSKTSSGTSGRPMTPFSIGSMGGGMQGSNSSNMNSTAGSMGIASLYKPTIQPSQLQMQGQVPQNLLPYQNMGQGQSPSPSINFDAIANLIQSVGQGQMQVPQNMVPYQPQGSVTQTTPAPIQSQPQQGLGGLAAYMGNHT